MEYKESLSNIKSLAMNKLSWLEMIGYTDEIVHPIRNKKEQIYNLIESILIVLERRMKTPVAEIILDELTGHPDYFLVTPPIKNEEQKARFKLQLNTVYGNHANFIYIFWGKNKECLYVGRTTKGMNRPSQHFLTYWFKSTRKVEVLPITNKRNMAKAECLAIHLFQPIINKTKTASIVSKSPQCPICRQLKIVKKELSTFLK